VRTLVQPPTRTDAEIRAFEQRTAIDRVLKSAREYYPELSRPILASKVSFGANDLAKEFANQKCWAIARSWKLGENNVWIYGPAGTGKTHMAHCLAAKCIASWHCVPGKILALDMISEWANKFPPFDDARLRKARLREAQHCRFLIIDDIAPPSQFWDPPSAGALYKIMTSRFDNRLSTVVTANQSPGNFFRDLAKVVNADTTLDRFKPMSVMQMSGESLRGK